MTERLIDLEVRLLLVRHGKRRVVETLAAITDDSVESLESDLRSIESKRKSKSRGRAKTPDELISTACRDRPETKLAISQLVSRFEARVFMSSIREIERFLDRAGIKHGKLKSRQAALPKVIEALASLPQDKLSVLVSPRTDSTKTDFALLAEELMGTGRDR